MEIQVFGTEIGETKFELKTFLVPAWKDAGFSGLPHYSFLLRRPNGGSANALLGRFEPRALVVQNFLQRGDERSGHWADTLDLSFHPRGHRHEYHSKMVIVTPSGDWKLHTFSKARRRRGYP